MNQLLSNHASWVNLNHLIRTVDVIVFSILVTFASVGNVRVAFVALSALAVVSPRSTSRVLAKAVAAVARCRGRIAVARRVVDAPVEHCREPPRRTNPICVGGMEADEVRIHYPDLGVGVGARFIRRALNS